MTLAVEDIADLLKLLKEHPEWRDQLRPVILGEEILQIPSRMDRVEAALERVTLRLDELTERLDRLAEEVRDLTTVVGGLGPRVDRIEGRLGNIEGGQLEARYERHLESWFSKWVRRAEKLRSFELDVLFDAVSSGQITEAEFEHIHQLDLIVKGVDRSAEQGTILLAVEVSYTVNPDDVSRASERASALGRAGLRTRAFVGGYRITEEAALLAEKLGVIVDLRRPAA